MRYLIEILLTAVVWIRKAMFLTLSDMRMYLWIRIENFGTYHDKYSLGSWSPRHLLSLHSLTGLPVHRLNSDPLK